MRWAATLATMPCSQRRKSLDTGELGEHARLGSFLDGLEIRLGAEIQTLVNGELAMTSAVTWTDAGAHTSQFVSDALAAPTAAQLQAGLLKTGNISLNVGNATVYPLMTDRPH
jgi:hypothetical protein